LLFVFMRQIFSNGGEPLEADDGERCRADAGHGSRLSLQDAS